MRSNVSVLLYKVSSLEHDQFTQVSLCTVSLLFANTLAGNLSPVEYSTENIQHIQNKANVDH